MNANYPMFCDEGPDSVPAAARRAREARRHPPRASGADGHTASLFPGSTGVDADPGRLVVMNEDPSGRNPHARMTLTFAGIARARLVLVTVSGRGEARGPGAGPLGRPGLPRLPRQRRQGRVDRRPCGGGLIPSRLKLRAAPAVPIESDDRVPPCTGLVDRARPRRPSARHPDGPGAGGARRRPRLAGDLLTEGVHPAHHAVPRPLRLLHLRPAAGPARVALPRPPSRSSPSPGPAPPPAATRPSSPWARAPRTATRSRAPGSTSTGHASTVDYLAAGGAPRGRGDRAPPPRQRRRARRGRPGPSSARVAPSQGMMVESLRDDLDCHRGAPDKTPARRLATLEAAGRLQIPFTTGILVGIGETVADRVDALVAIAAVARPPRPRAGGDRPELPAEGRHRHARVTAVPTRRLPPGHRAGPPDPPARGPPPGTAQPLRRLRPPARRRHRRLGRRLPRHRRPRQPGASLAGARPPSRRHRGEGVHPGAAAHRLSRARPRPRALARPGPALRGARSQRRRGARSRRPGRGVPRADPGGGRRRHRRRGRADRSPQHGVVLGRAGGADDPRPRVGARRLARPGRRGARRRAARPGGR